MKKKMLVGLAVIAMMSWTQSSLAARDTLPNGQPFQLLQETIDAASDANQAALAAETSARQAADSEAAAALAAEAAAREAADRVEATTRANADAAETSAREAADAVVDAAAAAAVAQEAAARIQGDNINAVNIAANRTAINNLNANITSINLRIDGIDAELAAVSRQVDGNSQEIAAAIRQIVETNAALAAVRGQADVNSLDIDALQENLGALIIRHQADIANLNLVSVNVQGQIDDLILANTALARELSARIGELRGLISGNTANIDVLLVDVLSINAQVSTNTTRIAALESWRGSVNGQLAGHTSQIATLNSELAALKDLVNMYHDPCHEPIAIGQTVTGELKNDGECLSVSRSNYAARYYTFTVASTKTVTIDMKGTDSWSGCPGGGTLSDPFQYLHQGTRGGPVIASDDDSGCGYQSQIVITLEAGTYSIEATSFTGGQFGTFVLSVN